MKSLNRAYKDKWNNWFINELKTITSVGNIKPPGYAKVITWISEIQKSFSPEIVSNSFLRWEDTRSFKSDSTSEEFETFENGSDSEID